MTIGEGGETEEYEYLLVEYVKEISSEVTYLLLIVTSLFLYILVDLFPEKMGAEATATGIAGLTSVQLLRLVFILVIIGGFILFGLSNITKRKIEDKFDEMFNKK